TYVWSCARSEIPAPIYLLAERSADGFATGSRGPTWVTYSPVTSVPFTTPFSVCSPGFDPSFQVRAARPRPSLTALGGVTTPPLDEQYTHDSGTVLPSTADSR